MTTSDLGSVQHLGFALYGFAPTSYPVQDLYHWAVDWFTRLGCRPHKAGAHIEGKDDGYYKLFRNLDRKLGTANFAGVTGWELVAMPEEFSAKKNWDYPGEDMGIHYSTNPFNRCLVFHVRESLMRDRMGSFLSAAKEACERICPQYGIGYRRQFERGPAVYGMGMLGGGAAEPGEDNLDYWRLLCRHEIYTFLRGVFPWNFLTSIQLHAKVELLRLVDWIQAKPVRGNLSPLTDQITLWKVAEDAIPAVRDELWKAGVILDRKRDFEDKMNEYHVGEDTVAESLRTGKPLVHRPPGPDISEEEMLENVLGAFGSSESRVFKIEKPGELRELSDEDLGREKKKDRKRNRE